MTILLDVNLLFILHQPCHADFQPVFKWFIRSQDASFATCAMTQAGLMRLLLQGIDGMDSFIISDARKAIQKFSLRPNHVYRPDMPAYLEAVEPFFSRLQGYRQVTDAYLLGLARYHGGKLTTLDRAMRHLAAPEFPGLIEIIE